MEGESDSVDAFETVFTRTTAGYFLREFCFSKTHFKPPTKSSEVELADFVIQLDDLLMVFQVKKRKDASTDPETERSWFERKVLKKATSQVRDTVSYLRDCPPEIANDRGRRISLPQTLDPNAIVKIVVFKGSDKLPIECARQRFHESKTAGFIHMITGNDWAALTATLVTPREIADYLRERESLCRAHPTQARAVSEKALVGHFIAEKGTSAPTPDLEAIVDRLIDDTDTFDLLGLLNLFPDRITTEAPAGTVKPHDMMDAGDDYYPIVREIAKLPRTDLAAFKSRFAWAWQRAGTYATPSFTRFVSSTGIGFVFAPVPKEFEAHAQNGLMNLITAHMYEQRLRRCIGSTFVNEGEWRFISWALLDQEWQHNSEMEEYLRENPLPAVREGAVPRYRLGDS
jgi:hypothetical protein